MRNYLVPAAVLLAAAGCSRSHSDAGADTSAAAASVADSTGMAGDTMAPPLPPDTAAPAPSPTKTAATHSKVHHDSSTAEPQPPPPGSATPNDRVAGMPVDTPLRWKDKVVRKPMSARRPAPPPSDSSGSSNSPP